VTLLAWLVRVWCRRIRISTIVELRRVWPRPYSPSRWVLGFGTSKSGNKGPGGDASESDGCGEWEREQLSTT
jgi:hypothetical protein